MPRQRIPVEIRFRRFWFQIRKPKTGCWLWPGTKDARGYGRIFVEYRGGKPFGAFAHRVAYAIFVDKIIHGREICHKCDTPACVRPDHLFMGTHADNMTDGILKGRFRNCGKNQKRGDDHPRIKISDRDIRRMRDLYNGGQFTMAQIAKTFGISIGLVHGILRGTRRKTADGKVRVVSLAHCFNVTPTRIIQIGKHGF